MFHEGSGKVMNTIPPNDLSYFEMLNEVVQQEPATALDPELMGPLAAIGIVKGKPFAPDARMKKILTEALAVANATSRSLVMNRARSELVLLSRLGLVELRCSSAATEFETPIPLITREGVKPFPPTGYRHVGCAHDVLLRLSPASRPGMAMRLTGIGSQYLFGFAGRQQELLRRRQDLQGDAAEGHSGGELLVVHALRQP